VSKHAHARQESGRRLLWRRIGTVLLIALPLFFFLPGIGFDSSHPASLARQSGAQQTWYYRVQEKDVLGTIAQRQLGTMRRQDEILALNPDVKPRALAVGSVLIMPPRQAAAPGPATPPAVVTGQSPKRLLLAFAALLALVVLVVTVASKLERHAQQG
jgi:hypothetical protein